MHEYNLLNKIHSTTLFQELDHETKGWALHTGSSASLLVGISLFFQLGRHGSKLQIHLFFDTHSVKKYIYHLTRMFNRRLILKKTNN